MPIGEEKNNAPSPEVMREEFVNLIVNEGKGKVQRATAMTMVDAILTKQIAYYAQMAEAEVDMSSPETVLAIGELSGVAAAVIHIGAEFTQFMSEDKRRRWQDAAKRLRDTVQRLEALL